MDAEFTTCAWNQLDCVGAVERRILERSCHTATLVGNYVYVIGGKKRSQFCGDVVRLNLETKTWERVFSGLEFLIRANHSATLIGDEIWVVGGMSSRQVYQDVQVLNTSTMEWSSPSLMGNNSLLKRCAHGSCIHPADSTAILLFGGYGGKATTAGTYSFLNDLVIIQTAKKSVEVVKCTSAGDLPGRAYHTFAAVGTRCFAIGGKGQSGTLADGHFLEVFDVRTSRWLSPPKISGQAPHSRSSHKTAAVGSSILITGGVLGPANAEQRMDDAALLCVGEGNGGTLKLSWHSIGGSVAGPAARSGHAVVVHGKRVLMLMGYKGSNTYLTDCWALEPSIQTPRVRFNIAAAPPHANSSGTTTSPDPSKVPGFDATKLLAGPPSTSHKTPAGFDPNKSLTGAPPSTSGKVKSKPGLMAALLMGGLRTPSVRNAGVSNGVASGKVSSPVSKRPSVPTPEWRNVKRSKTLQEKAKSAAVTPAPRTPALPPTVYDLASEDPSQVEDAAIAAGPPTSPAADAVYIKKIRELEDHVARLQSAGKENRTSESKLRTRVVALEAQVQDLTQARERVQQLLVTAKRDLEERDVQLAGANEKLQQTEQQLAGNQQELQSVQQQLMAAKHDAGCAHKEAVTRQGHMKQELNELKHQLAARTASSQQYQALADQRRKEAESIRQQLSEAQQRLQETAKQLVATSTEKQQIEGMMREKETGIARLNSETARLREELKQQCVKAERKSAEHAAAFEQLRGEHSSLHSTHQKLQDSMNSVSRTMEAAQAELTLERRARTAAAQQSAQEKEALEKQLQEAAQKLAEADTELVRLKAYELNTQGEIDRLSAELQAAKDKVAVIEEQVAQTTAEVTKLRGENYNLSRQLEILRSAGSPLLGEAQSLQGLMNTLVEKLQEHHAVLSPSSSATQ